MDDKNLMKGMRISGEEFSDKPWPTTRQSELKRLQDIVGIRDGQISRWEDHYDDLLNTKNIWRFLAVVEGIILAALIIRKWL